MLESNLLSKLDLFFQEQKLHEYRKRELVLHADDTPSSVFYIKNGYVRVYRLSEQGEELTLTILKPNDFFPLTYGMHMMTNPYYLEAITQLALWKAPQDQFVNFVQANPDVLHELTTRLMVRFDGVMSRMEYLVFRSAFVKVATTLLICAKQFGLPLGNDVVMQVPLTHRDIATLVGITRETTSVELKKLEKKGFLGRVGRLFVLKNINCFEESLLESQEGSAISYAL